MSQAADEPAEPVPRLKFPKVMYIVTPTQLLQGFSQTLMLSIKAIFMTDVLGYTEDLGVMINHIFIAFEPFSHLTGAMLADSRFGKWKIIIAGSILLRIGDVFYILSVMPGMAQNAFFLMAISCTTLFSIHIPVLEAFFSEQFKMPEQEHQLKTYYNIYYWGRNVMSVVGSYAGSRLADIPCLGQQYCYAAPIALWVCVEILFAVIILSLSHMYVKKSPSQSIIIHFLRCINRALKIKRKSKGMEKKERWIDYADDKYDADFRNDAYRLMAISYFFIIGICYWALYDQMYSRFIYQTARLDGRINDYIKLYPGDIIMVNPLLVIVFLPILEYAVYPLCRKLRILTTELQKVATSDYLIASAFLVACILEWMIEYYEFRPPGPSQCSVTIINGLNEDVKISGKMFGTKMIQPFDMIQFNNLEIDNKKYEATLRFEAKLIDISTILVLQPGKGLNYFLTREGIVSMKGSEDFTIDPLGNPKIRIICQDECYDIKLKGIMGTSAKYFLKGEPITNKIRSLPILVGTYEMQKYNTGEVLIKELKLRDKNKYAIVMFTDDTTRRTKLLTLYENQQLTFFWIIPQLVLLTLGEIMHAIPWRIFLYTQSPPSMRSVVFALDLLARSLGDLCVAIIAGCSFLEHKYEFMSYSLIMYSVSILFTVLAIRYKPVKSHE